MSPISPVPVILIFVLAWVTTWLLARRFAVILPAGRVASIDGLRGYLGFAVFLHHGSIWFFAVRTGQWDTPPSNLYLHLGQSSVAVFFMITGFLFFSKLIESKAQPIDWTVLYISRLFRLLPLYLVAVGVTFFIVAVMSNWQLRVPAESLALGVTRWLAFTMAGAPELNGVAETPLITAGVTWTLRYEWAFYLMLPLLALLVRVRPPIGYLILALASALAFTWFLDFDLSYAKPFMGGMVAAVLVRNEKFRIFASTKIATLLVLACAVATVVIYPVANDSMPLLLLTIAFTLIAGGNTLFGLLTNHTSRVLGEMAYGIYLLHGILLFVVFRFFIGFRAAAKLDAVEHWMWIALCTPVLISICFLTFRRLEQPAMRISRGAAAWVKTSRISIAKTVLGRRV